MDKQNFINEIKKLKSIKADEGFKFDLRKNILKEVGNGFVINISDVRLNNKQTSNFQKIIINLLPRRKNMFIPLLLIIALLGGGAGTTYASQSSLPGDTLYPVKIATEKVQTVLTIDDAKEANLHLKFSEERLSEVDELAQKGKADPELVKEAIDNYKKELSEARDILNNFSVANSGQSTQIARNLASATTRHKEALVKISGEVEGDDVLDVLKDAWKEAINHNDDAKIELLKKLTISDVVAPAVGNVNTANDTNTTVGATDNSGSNATQTDQTIGATSAVITQNPELQKMVGNKISEASHKISEAEKYIVKKEARSVDASDAKTKIADAKTKIADAQNLLSQAKYTEAFLKAKDAHQMAQNAKESLENDYKREHNKKEDSDDDENIFILPAESLNGNSIDSTTTGDKSSQKINSQEINERKDKVEKEEKEEKEEDKDSHTKNKSESEHESEGEDRD